MEVTNLKCISGNHFISDQIEIDDINDLANFGIKLIINNRPDGEEFNQISSKLLKDKAESLGIKFIDIPFASGTLNKQKILDFSNLIKNNHEKSLFYCRSGARSSIIWGLASVIYLGLDLEECMLSINNSGYDSSMLPNMVEFFKIN
jgi:uncharacterized protein (TIGR01244 family)